MLSNPVESLVLVSMLVIEDSEQEFAEDRSDYFSNCECFASFYE